MRSTLSDANKRRPVAVFSETFGLVARQLDRQTRHEGAQMLRLIDSTPIPLGKLCDWAKSNGRIRGMKMHVVYDPQADHPRILDITDANVNDAQIGRTIRLEAGATYVFDKGYCHYGWWTAIANAGSIFVTRPKSNMGLKLVCDRPVEAAQGDGFSVLDDAEVSFASKGDSKLPIRLRRLTVKRQEGDTLTLLTNDLDRGAIEIAQLYKGRWQIELLFRWIKQHLKIRKFLGYNDNAIRLQLFAAMLAYALLRIAHRAYRIPIPILRFADLCGSMPVRAAKNRGHRQAATRQSKPQKRSHLARSDWLHLCLIFPRTAVRLRGEGGPKGRMRGCTTFSRFSAAPHLPAGIFSP
jgi:IS4 transposase